MAHLLSLAAGVLPDFGPADTIAAAAAAGFDAVGIWIERAQWSDAVTRDLKARLVDSGIPALDAEVVWLRPGPVDPWHLRMVDIAAELGAANLLVVSSDPDAGGTAEKLRALCEHAGNRVRVALEFGLFTDVKTIDQALAILARVDHPAAALLVDPIHLARSGGSVADVAAVPRALLVYAQFCDAPPVDFDLRDPKEVIRDAVDARLLPGDGILPLAGLLGAMPAAIPLSVELRSKALRDGYPDATARAAVVLAATRAFVAAIYG